MEFLSNSRNTASSWQPHLSQIFWYIHGILGCTKQKLLIHSNVQFLGRY